MGIVVQEIDVYKDLFIWLQRSQRATSPLAFRQQGFLGLRSGLPYDSRNFEKFPCIRVAGDALAFFFNFGKGRRGKKQESQRQNHQEIQRPSNRMAQGAFPSTHEHTSTFCIECIILEPLTARVVQLEHLAIPTFPLEIEDFPALGTGNLPAGQLPVPIGRAVQMYLLRAPQKIPAGGLPAPIIHHRFLLPACLSPQPPRRPKHPSGNQAYGIPTAFLVSDRRHWLRWSDHRSGSRSPLFPGPLTRRR